MSDVPMEIGLCANPGLGMRYVWVYVNSEGKLEFVHIGIKNNLAAATDALNKSKCECQFPGLWTVISNRLVELELETDDGI